MNTIGTSLFVSCALASSAIGSSFALGPWNDRQPPYSDCGLILWTSPADGFVTISGDANPTWSTQSVWVEYVPAAIAAGGLNPGNVLQSGTTPLYNGSVQYPYQQPGQPAAFGSTAIPLRVSGHPETPLSWQVQQGDVIAAMTQQFNLFTGDTAYLNLNVSMSSDFQGSGGTLTAPVSLTGQYLGLSGQLKPAADHAVDTYEFYWASGDFSGTAMTNTIFNGPASGFQSGMLLELFSSGTLLDSATVLNSASSSPFDFGSRPAGNYTLRVTDLNSSDDPPYNIELSGPIDAPVPEPAAIVTLSGGLIFLARRRRTPKIQIPECMIPLALWERGQG